MDGPGSILGYPEGIAAAFLGVLGLVIGSFLNVVIARVPFEESIVSPGSRCPKCGHVLPWYENIPVLSWLFLRGKCSGCKTPISWRYPAVELLTAALMLACLRRFGWTWPLVSALTMVVVLVPLTFIDLEHWLLPHELTLPGIAFGLLLMIPQGWDRLRDGAIGAAAGFFLFWALEWVGEKIFAKEALGAGDKYLLALLGAFLTWKSLLAVVFLSSLQGSIIGVALLLIRGRAGPAPVEPEPPAAPPVEAAPPTDPAAPPADPAAPTEDDDWVPGPTNMPFGPWLAIAGMEIMLLGPWLAETLPRPLGYFVGG